MTRIPAPYEYASADLNPGAKGEWRGYVDGWDAVKGIQGWALAMAAPLTPLTLELLVGDTVFERIATGLARPDVGDLLGVPVLAGFCIPPAVFARLARLNPRRRGTTVRLRIAQTQLLLSWRERPPVVGELVDAWRQAAEAALQHRAPEIGKGERLRARLALMRSEAEAFQTLALRPSSENDLGHIDAVHVGSEGLIWLVGWMLRGADTEFPALLVDRQKYPGGAAVLQYERQDLASRLVGFVGVLDTAWSPPAVVKDFFVYLGPKGGRQLRADVHTKVIGLEAFLTTYRLAEAAWLAGSADAIGALLISADSWAPGNAAAAGIAAESSVDRLLMLPGFGCIAEGWAVCPAKQVRSFQMKLGDCVLDADESATYFRPRPDVASSFGVGSSLGIRAGFVTVLRGPLPASVSGTPLLRVIHEDGSSVVTPFASKQLQQLDCVADSDEMLRLYPSVRHERFYPALLDAIRRRLVARMRPPVAITVAVAPRLVVVRLPAERHNLRLCFDHIARIGTADDSPIGICLIAERTQGLAQAKLLFEELRSRSAMPLSLFCVDEAAQGFSALPFILGQLAADRFVYVDGGVLLTMTGWDMAVQALGQQGHLIRFLEIVDESGAPDRINGAISAGCFAWTTAALLEWLGSSTPVVRGVFHTNGLPDPRDADHVLAGAAMRVEPLQVSRFADMIDADLLSGARHVQLHA